MVTYQKMSLFDAPHGSIIVHACNSQGVWGSGIAKPFKEKYPKSFREYHEFCKMSNDEPRGSACGQAGLSSSYDGEPHTVGWLITSHNYGQLKDSPEVIKVYTTLALHNFCKLVVERNYLSTSKIDVYSNKFNSGLFSVPWEDTELILNTVLKSFPKINWIVCSEV